MSRAPVENNARYLDAAELARTRSVWESEYTSTHFSRLRDIAVSDVPQIAAQLRFEQWSGHAAIQGHMTGSVELICQRCLKPMRFLFDEAFDLVLVGADGDAAAVPDSHEVVTLETPLLDVQWLIEEQLLLALPLIPKHEDEAECKAQATSVKPQQSSAVSDESAAIDRQRPFQNLRELLRKS